MLWSALHCVHCALWGVIQYVMCSTVPCEVQLHICCAINCTVHCEVRWRLCCAVHYTVHCEVLCRICCYSAVQSSLCTVNSMEYLLFRTTHCKPGSAIEGHLLLLAVTYNNCWENWKYLHHASSHHTIVMRLSWCSIIDAVMIMSYCHQAWC